jgi:hypothetical protein
MYLQVLLGVWKVCGSQTRWEVLGKRLSTGGMVGLLGLLTLAGEGQLAQLLYWGVALLPS